MSQQVFNELTDIAVSSGPLGLTITFSVFRVETSVSGTIRQTLEECFVPFLAVAAHPAEVALAVPV